MHGSYTMRVADSGETFEATIQPFRLATPRILN
jgi:uncharacterized protein affecting Mg2+/Co2+ transport